jgi:hypothetical protein
MTDTLEHVAVTFLGWLQLGKYYMSVTFGPPSSRIVLRLPKDAHPTKFFIKRYAPTLFHCILLSPSTPFPNGALILCNVILPQSGGIVISSFPLIISKYGLRLFLLLLMMVVLHLSPYSTTSSLTLVFHKTLSLITVHIFKNR